MQHYLVILNLKKKSLLVVYKKIKKLAFEKKIVLKNSKVKLRQKTDCK